MGFAKPFRIAMMPAIVVVLTAPSPTSNTPNLPPAGAIGKPLVTAENYIIRVAKCRVQSRVLAATMLKLRAGPSPYQTAVAMVGARAGDRVLMIGADDADLAAHVALVTGLSGDVQLADHTPGAAARVEAAVRRVGALVEFTEAPPSKLPFDPATFDAVVINQRLSVIPESDRLAAATEAIRVARPGGRIVVIEAGPQEGFFARFSKPRTVMPAADVQAILTAAGCRATRVLAEAGGAVYVEGLVPRGSS
jgi:ubiquinone/menaquinone biosynthesis C-methylase UbiE